MKKRLESRQLKDKLFHMLIMTGIVKLLTGDWHPAAQLLAS